LATLTRGIALRLRNVATDTSDCTRMPTRFVPFATFAGRPSTIRSGSVISEPLPASVLMKPETKPTIGTATSSSWSACIR